jgi:hypothetical protein
MELLSATEGREDRMKKITLNLVCTKCGKEYRTTVSYVSRFSVRNRRKFCNKCLAEFRKANAREAKVTTVKTCEMCGEKFAGHTSGKYCPACVKEANRLRNREYRRRQRIKKAAFSAKPAAKQIERLKKELEELKARRRRTGKKDKRDIDPYFLSQGNTQMGRNFSVIEAGAMIA